MVDYSKNIGRHIREVRIQRNLSQEKLAECCEFSNTTLSAYENGRKVPSLVTIAKIAKSLNTTVERLYYGDENISFIISEPDEGRKIVNAIFFLWESGTIMYYENIKYGIPPLMFNEKDDLAGMYIYVSRFGEQIKRLMLALNDYKEKKETYSDPKQYLELLLSSVAKDINNEIQKSKMEV